MIEHSKNDILNIKKGVGGIPSRFHKCKLIKAEKSKIENKK